ncbi:MAG: aldehyde dehydrogenase family protein [Conexivisphaerales archaeon]
MTFKSEATYITLKERGKEEEFHTRYEEALSEFEKTLGQHLPLYIGGKEVKALREYAKKSPIDSRLVVRYIQLAESQDVERAVKAAKDSFEDWSSMSYRKRADIMQKAADIMSKRKYELAAAMTLDNGKNRYEAVGDVDEAIDYLRYYSEEIVRNNGYEREIKGVLPGERVRSVMKPYGVWGVISPFNFPLAITCGMTTGALVTGNTVVLKPATDSPLLAFYLYDILSEAGLPDGVLNVITGSGASAGQPIIEHKDVMGIAFTGSYAVGAKGYLDFSAKGPKPFIAEMGGKNAAIVTDKANLDKAAEGVARGAFGFSGQKCSATSRLIVFRSVKEKMLEKLLKFTSGLRLGDPRKKETFLGPVINEAAFMKYSRAVEDAKKDGRILTGGAREEKGDEVMPYGYYVRPTIVDSLPPSHRLNYEELFVPFLTVITVDNLQQALEVANSVEYGLTGAIFSEDEKEVSYFFDHIQAGVVYANRVVGATTGAMVGVQPFVGWKHSGSTGKGAGGQFYLPQFLREQAQSTYQ